MSEVSVCCVVVSQQTEYELVMEEQVSFVISETVGGYNTDDKMTGPSEAERRKMSLEEVRT